jgi:hypothetical protein
MPARSPRESAWTSLGGMSLVPAWPCRRCSDHVGSEAPHTCRGGARSEDGADAGGGSAADGHRLDCHDPGVVVGRPGPQPRCCSWGGSVWRRCGGWPVGELVRVGVCVRPIVSRSAPEQRECGSGCATSGPPAARELGKRESGCGSARTAPVRCALNWESKRPDLAAPARAVAAAEQSHGAAISQIRCLRSCRHPHTRPRSGVPDGRFCCCVGASDRRADVEHAPRRGRPTTPLLERVLRPLELRRVA